MPNPLTDPLQPSRTLPVTRAERNLQVPGFGWLYAQTWEPKPLVGSIVIVHGGGEHSGRYDPTARWLASHGYLVYAMDLPGHGRSPGIRGHIGHFDHVVNSAAAGLEDAAKLTGLPRPILLGHSLGGLIATVCAARNPGAIRTLMLTSPSWALRVAVPWWKRAAAHVISPIWPSLTLQRPRIGGNILSHDPEAAAAYDADPLIHDRASVRFYTEFRRILGRLPALLPAITVPTLVLQAGDDRVVSADTTRRYFPLIGAADKKLVVYDKLYHEVLNEAERARVRADLLEWLRRHH